MNNVYELPLSCKHFEEFIEDLEKNLGQTVEEIEEEINNEVQFLFS